MTSTENLLKDPDKSTNTLESGYHSEGTGDGLPRPQHKEKASKKKKPHRYEGLENKGFVPADNEYVDTSVKHRARRTSSENTAQQKTTNAEYSEVERRHSYAGQSSVDTTQIVDGGSQNGGTLNRRRSSTADEDLRRRACYNSMRLRRGSSSSSQLPPSEVEVSVDDDVFHADSQQTGTRKKQQGDSPDTREVNRPYSMGSLCSAVELENRKMDEYSRRLSFALEERAKLEQELNILRRTASVATMPAEEKWKISTQIHFRNEKYNSERRLSSRGNEDKQFSFEQLKRIQLEQSRKLPNVPGVGEEIYDEVCRPVIEKKVERLPQRKLTEEFPQQLEEKRKSDSFHLSDSEKERRERKTANLATDLWKKLLKGEKFHVEDEATRDKTRDATRDKTRDATTKNEKPSEVKKSENSSYGKRSGMGENDSEIARLAEGSIPTTSGVQKSQRKLAKEKPLVRSESESSLERTDAFRRNQRRPLRYKRASTSTEPSTGATKPSTSTTLNESKTNKPHQEKTEKLEGIRSTEAVSQNHSKWFDYMLPPGKRGNRPVTGQASQHEIAANTLSLPEKLRYYQELQEKRSREENSFDLADAFMAAEDAEAEKEFQRKAAGEAAVLRREASRLLWQAMNLERICDPNARVRHIFTPY